MAMRLRLVVLALAIWSASCAPKAANETPEGAVRELIEQLRSLDGTEGSARKAFDLLSSDTKQNLVARAERYSAASGKHIEPQMMLAPASFIERFKAGAFESEIKGSYAVVRARGLLDVDRAEVRCVYEDKGWRVQIDLPPLSPVEIRPRDGAPAAAGPKP